MNQMLRICNHVKQDTMSIHNVTNGGPKRIVKLIDRNIQAPKFLSKKYGVGALQVFRPLLRGGRIRGQAIHVYRIRPYCNCSRSISSKGVRKLETIRNIRIKNPNFIFKRIYNLILLEDLYLIAYQNLKSKKGVITPGTDGETPDGLTVNSINKVIFELQTEKFEFNPARRVKIPKPNGGFRNLSIPSFKDKLVQEVIRLILEAIYEPTFASYSHGFRKGKSCHSALKDIRVIFAGTK